MKNEPSSSKNKKEESLREAGRADALVKQLETLAAQPDGTESKKALEVILNTIDEVVYHVDMRFESGKRLRFVSDSAETIYGIPKEDFFRNKDAFLKYYHPEDLERIKLSSAALEKEKKPQEYHYRFLNPKTEKTIWIEERVFPQFDEHGKLLEVFGVARDITRKKEFEQEIIESRESYRALIEQNPDGIIVAGFDQKILFANKSVLEISGIAAMEDLIGHKLLEFLSPAQQKRSAERIKIIAQGGQVPFEVIEIQHSDGRIVQCESKPSLYNYLGKQTILVFLRSIAAERQLAKEQLRAQIAEEANLELQKEISVRKKTEKELFSTQKYLRLLINSSIDMICASDKEGYVTEFNKAAQRTFGFTSEEVIGKHVSFLYKDPNQRMDVMKELIDGGGYFSGEVTNIKKNGETFTALLSASILKDGNGNVFGSMGVSRDITEWKRTETELKLNEEKYRAIYNQAYIGIALVDTQSDRYIDANQRLCDMLGYEPEELRNKTIHDLRIPGDLSRLPSGKDFIRGGFERIIDEHRYRHKNGNAVIVNVTVSLVRSEENRPLYFVYVYEDLTPKRHAEEQLRLQAAKLNAIIETSSHMIWTVDKNFRLTSFNGNQAKWLKRSYNVNAYTGMPMAAGRMLSANIYNDFWVEKMNNTLKGAVQNFEVAFTHRSGDVSWREIYLNPIRDDHGNVVEVSAIAHDITDKKQVDESLRLSLREKEVLLKEVHHRVKNNLQVISSILNLQSSYVRDKKILDILLESQNRIKSMAFVHESLYQTKDFSNISFREYVENISSNLVQSYSALENVPELKLSLQPIKLHLDTAIPCGLIINELLSNSLKYAFADGRKGKISINIKQEEEHVTMVIADNGIGLPPKIDFRKTESLGLQLVVSLVEQINGKIKSDTKKGTKFTIEFSSTPPNA
ncbi:MAG: PAS domain S-box protein [Bacteroidetes bacterium]|nr:PAS domain S-box protein [Bacteroidota bacterium]